MLKRYFVGLLTAIYLSNVFALSLVAGVAGNKATATPFVATGGTVSIDGDYTVRTFNSGADFVVVQGSADVQYLVIAGGGGGGNGGGGGAGGYRTGTFTALGAGTYAVVVGAGGAAATPTDGTAKGSSGSNSSINSVVSTGGGGGGSYAIDSGNGLTGGSGGGAYYTGTAGAATASPVQGNAGGTASISVSSSGGGGGAGAVGGNATAGEHGGVGGAGTASSITGASVTRAGGGGGRANGTGGAGGAGGGGAGGGISDPGTAGTANTGGGGGGAPGGASGGAGGSGVVILRHLTTTGYDAVFSDVVLLAINDNAANTSTTFTDQSASAHVLTADGTAQYSTAQAPTGMTSSALVTGGGIETADSADWDFGTGNFTVEYMVRRSGAQTDVSRMFERDIGGANGMAAYFTTSDQKVNIALGGVYPAITSTAALPDTTWTHVAIVRDGTTSTKLYIDGTQSGSTYTTSYNLTGSTGKLIIASYLGTDYLMTGNVSNFRVTKNIARYTTTFTPPTLPLPTQ